MKPLFTMRDFLLIFWLDKDSDDRPVEAGPAGQSSREKGLAAGAILTWKVERTSPEMEVVGRKEKEEDGVDAGDLTKKGAIIELNKDELSIPCAS